MWRITGSKVLSLIGGIGLGAGLLYILDPDKGRRRRESLLHGAQDLGRGVADRAGSWAHTAKDYAGDAASSVIETVSSAVNRLAGRGGEYAKQARDYASEKADTARQYALHQLGGHDSHILSTTACALGSMALGVALMYAFDPTSGRNRRRAAADMARQAAHKASDVAGTVSEAVSGAVSTGYEKVSGAVSSVAKKFTGRTGDDGNHGEEHSEVAGSGQSRQPTAM